jgi:hypothetical protein
MRVDLRDAVAERKQESTKVEKLSKVLANSVTYLTQPWQENVRLEKENVWHSFELKRSQDARKVWQEKHKAVSMHVCTYCVTLVV